MRKIVLCSYLSFIFTLCSSQGYVSNEQYDFSISDQKMTEPFENGLVQLPKSYTVKVKPIPKPSYTVPQPLPFYEKENTKLEEKIDEEIMNKIQELTQGQKKK